MQNVRVWASTLLILTALHVAQPHHSAAQSGPAVLVAKTVLREAGRLVFQWLGKKVLDKPASRRLERRLTDAEGQLKRAIALDSGNAMVLGQLLQQVREQHQILGMITATQRKDSVFIASVLGRQRALLQDNNRLLQSNNALLQSVRTEQTESFAKVMTQLENLPVLVAAAAEKQGATPTVPAAAEPPKVVSAPVSPSERIKVTIDQFALSADKRRASLAVYVENVAREPVSLALENNGRLGTFAGPKASLSDDRASTWFVESVVGIEVVPCCYRSVGEIRQDNFTNISPGERVRLVMAFTDDNNGVGTVRAYNSPGALHRCRRPRSRSRQPPSIT